MTFVEDLQALNHLTVQGKGVSCRAQFEYGAEPPACPRWARSSAIL